MVERVGRRIVRQALLPVGRHLAGLGGDGVDVGGEPQRHDVGLEPVDHRARLGAGTTMRGLNWTVSPVLAFQSAMKAALIAL